MRLVTAFALLVLVSLSPMSIGQDRAKAFSAQPVPGATLVKRAKFVCGDTPQGYRCRTESGAVRRGKMMKIPNSKPSVSSNRSSGGAPWGGGGLWGGGTLWDGNKNDAPASTPSATSAVGGGAIAKRLPGQHRAPRRPLHPLQANLHARSGGERRAAKLPQRAGKARLRLPLRRAEGLLLPRL